MHCSFDSQILRQAREARLQAKKEKVKEASNASANELESAKPANGAETVKGGGGTAGKDRKPAKRAALSFDAEDE